MRTRFLAFLTSKFNTVTQFQPQTIRLPVVNLSQVSSQPSTLSPAYRPSIPEEPKTPSFVAPTSTGHFYLKESSFPVFAQYQGAIEESTKKTTSDFIQPSKKILSVSEIVAKYNKLTEMKYENINKVLNSRIKECSGMLINDLQRMDYDIKINKKTIFSTTEIMKPVLDNFKSLKNAASNDIQKNKIQDQVEKFIEQSKEETIGKIKAVTEEKQFEMLNKVGCQNIIIAILNFPELIKKSSLMLEKEDVLNDLIGLELGNILSSKFEIKCDTEDKNIKLNVSIDNHSVGKNVIANEKVKTMLVNMRKDLTAEQIKNATHECAINLSILINTDGELTCQLIDVKKGRKIIDIESMPDTE